MPSPTKKTKKVQEPDETRIDETGFMGGLPIDLDREMADGGTLRQKLSLHIGTILEEELVAQKDRIDNLIKWEKQYKGVKKPKNQPWPDAANCAIPVTRALTDAIVVRIFDTIWGQLKVWIIKAIKPEFKEVAVNLEDGLDWWQRNIAKLKKKLFSPMLQCIKSGTGCGKIEYIKKKRTIYTYATTADVKDKNTKVYTAANGQKIIKKTITEYDGPDIFPIDRADFIVSSDATTIQDAYLVGFRSPMRKFEVKAKAKRGKWDPLVVEMMTNPDPETETRKERAANQKITIPVGKDLYWIWELWFNFDVDDDNEEDSIVVTWHQETGQILDAIYNPHFFGFRPFFSLVFNPVEFRFDGEGAVEILDAIQREIDTVHNQRLDRMSIINNPPRLIRDGAVLDEDDLESLGPGKIITVDDPETAAKELLSTDIYPSTWQEEAILEKYAEKAIGATPQTLGQPTSERPVARETLALLQEANKKFKFGIDNIRDCLTEIGYIVIEMFAQYSPEYKYQKAESGQFEEAGFDIPSQYIRDGISVDLRSSSEMLNTEVRREIHLTAYQLLSDFYTKSAGMMQAILTPGIPMKFKLYLMKVMEVSGKIMEEILRDFDIVAPDEMVVTANEMIDQSDLMPQQPPMGMGGPGGPPPGAGAGPPGARPPQSPQGMGGM